MPPVGKRSRIRKISRKRAAEQQRYKVARLAFLAEFPICANPKCGKDCDPPKPPRKATDIHHTRGRIGRLYLNSRYWRPVCRRCHDFINENPAAARALGLLCAPGQWGKQPETELMERNPKAFEHDYEVYLRAKELNDPTAQEPRPDPYGLDDWHAKSLKKVVADRLIPPPPADVTLSDQISEASRELAVRQKAYPRWIAEGKINKETAQRRTAIMVAIVATLRRIKLHLA